VILGTLLLIALGISTIGLGFKDFSAKGLPFTKDKNITGASAKIIGVICLCLGIGFIALGIAAPFIR
jgi:hypothetical protein